MRYSCIAQGESCGVDVELKSDSVRAELHSVANRTILSVYNATIDTSHGCPDPDVFGEQVARDTLADFEARGTHGAQLTAYAGRMTRLV